jgi:hypothetical protein
LQESRQIPSEMLYVLDKKLYMASLTVEGLETMSAGQAEEGGDYDNDSAGEDGFNDDDCDDLDSQDMDTDK